MKTLKAGNNIVREAPDFRMPLLLTLLGRIQGITKPGARRDWQKKVCHWLKTGHKEPANPKSYGEKAVFNTQIC